MPYNIENEKKFIALYSDIGALKADKPHIIELLEYLEGWEIEDILAPGSPGEDTIAYAIANYIYSKYGCDITKADIRKFISTKTITDSCNVSSEHIMEGQWQSPPTEHHILVGIRYWTETGFVYCHHRVKWIWLDYNKLRDLIASKCIQMFYRCPYCGQYFLTKDELDLHILNAHPGGNGTNGNGGDGGDEVETPQWASLAKNIGLMAAGGVILYMMYTQMTKPTKLKS